MHERDRDGSFPHGAGNSFDITCSNVTDSKYSRQACFEFCIYLDESPLRLQLQQSRNRWFLLTDCLHNLIRNN